METKYEIWFDAATIYLKDNQGSMAYLPLEVSRPLLNASDEERSQYEFSPFGIHWKKLDEDLCYEGFIPTNCAK